MNILAVTLLAQALIAPDPGVIFRPSVIKADEKPVVVETNAKIAADNGLFRRVETTIVFTNPNSRVFEGELEFPVPDGATVCGYELEVGGSMVPGVVVPKEEARVAFENEKRKGVDPGIVEHVKGNVWKTRIYPLMPNTPRMAKVAYIVADEKIEPGKCVWENSPNGIFVGRYLGEEAAKRESLSDRLRKAVNATIYWDASMSRKDNFQADRNLLEALPEKGLFTLRVFRNVIEDPVTFETRAELLKAIDALVYDGGTCIEKARRRKEEGRSEGVFIFSDEYKEPKPRTIEVRRHRLGEEPVDIKEGGTLLATAWAAQRVEDLSDDAQAHKDELVEIGRKYGVASSVTSMIVLESLEQYQTYRIEPPKCMSFYDEWKKWRAAEDDPIAAEKAKADHRAELLRYWEERVKWWNDPVPPKKTPKSGLFDGVARASSLMAASRASAPMAEDAAEPVTVEESAAMEPEGLAPSGARSLVSVSVFGGRVAKAKSGSEAAANVADVKLAAWNPDMPYLKAMSGVANGCAYAEYLKQREVYGNSPAFYLDCAGWFFKAKDLKLGARIISNLSELKLEDVGMWRTMGWRLREAGLYDEAVEAFRHVLEMRPEEPQSRRDLALVFTERGKSAWDTDKRRFHDDIMEAVVLLQDAAFTPPARRSGSRGNDFQTSVLALEELNGLRMWWQSMKIRSPFPWRDEDAAFRRDLPCELRIVLSWDTDETDVDLHVLEPDGEEAFYGHRRTSSGGFVSEDVTTGYGPEEYLRKTADKGVYKILANYFASHRQQLTGAATISATVYTGWGTDKETRQIMSLRLDKPKDRQPIGEVEIR